MKRLAHLFAVTSIIFVGCRPTKAATGLDALRTIRIEKRTILTLGGKMPQPSAFCLWTGTTCALKPGTFWGAKAMSLTKTESGSIYQFQFGYGMLSDDAVNAQINDYTRLLGKPSKDSTVKNREFNVRELEWSDSSTTFDLSYKTDRNQTEGSARLLDNALSRPTL
ncbi:MAG TPA: hypothetical protein VIJ65_08030 [Acidobacteriaceae bacterium]